MHFVPQHASILIFEIRYVFEKEGLEFQVLFGIEADGICGLCWKNSLRTVQAESLFCPAIWRDAGSNSQKVSVAYDGELIPGSRFASWVCAAF